MKQSEQPPHVFISYTHDSPAHQECVRALAERLRRGGVETWIDQYAAHPHEGWPQWMRRQIRDAQYVLVICTETYQRRVDLREEPGRGLGAIWEGGLITISVYDAQGRNEKFIPVVFSATDVQFIPDFLRGATWYDVSTEDGFEALYARLTGQELVPVPPLGPRRIVAKQESSTPPPLSGQRMADRHSVAGAVPPAPLVLLEYDRHRLFIPAERVEERGERLEAVVMPQNGEDAAFLRDLKSAWGQRRTWIAYGNTAHPAVVEAADHSHHAAGDRYKLVLTLEADHQGNFNEVGTTGKSVDDIAELRARRILLDERPPPELARWGTVDNTLEMLVRGLGSGPGLTASPLPDLYQELRGRGFEYLLDAARLVAILELRRTGTAEHILELELRPEGADSIHVHFRGRRRKVYTNKPAAEISIDGICQLSS